MPKQDWTVLPYSFALPFRGERIEIVFNQARELLAVHEVA
jgi:hypothetical protein